MRRIAPVLAMIAAGPAAAQSVASPDGRNVVTVETNAADQPTYRIDHDAQVLIAPSVLGLELERYARLSDGLRVTGVDRSTGTDRYTLRAGKVSAVEDRYDQIVVHYAEPAGKARRLDVIVRAYDGGVALRYAIPAQPNLTQLRLVNELTQFAFPADDACTGLNLGSFGTSHEGEFDPVNASAIRAHHLFDLPLACRGANASFAIAEANVTDWPAMYLSGIESGTIGVAARLSRRIDDPTIAVKADVGTGLVSPWRVVMIGADPGALIGNTLLTSLNPAPIGDFAWVKPGKTAWDWWSGPTLAGVPVAGSNDATEKGFIDFAASLKLPYMMIDEGWYVNSGGGGTLYPGADPTRTVPAIDLPDLVAYGHERGVGLVVWVHWALVDRDMENILSFLERTGVKGIKIDFMNRDDQEMIGFYHRVAAATARHHLLLDLHGATHPWGMTRTWPHFLTQEGVFGAEQNKWTARITARHNVTLPYTRMLAGPMDYTPGGYRNGTPETFRITATAPEVQTTRAAELAKYVVFESPLQSVADSPDAYRGQPGLDFLAAVPTSWDETRFLAGRIGEDVAIARRKGDVWYIGAMTDAARTLSLPLGFLAKGRFAVRSWQDGPAPTDLVVASRAVDAGDTLSLPLARAGGAAVTITPVR